MTFDQFRESIRIGVTAGVYEVKYVVSLLHAWGCNTTRDVDEGDRAMFIRHLDGRATDQ